MESLANYIRRNIKLAFKSVVFNYKQYAWFFAAIFVIQIFFCTISQSSFNNNKVEYDLVSEEYNYHLLLKQLNADQYLLIENDTATVFKNNRFYEITNVIKRNGRGSSFRYDVYIMLNGNIKKSFNKFEDRYIEQLKDMDLENIWSTYKTPLLDFQKNETANLIFFIQFLLLISVLSIFLLTAIYNIRTNYYKFTYGIFMSFGGGFKKIYATSFWEMMIVTLFTFIPASTLSSIVAILMYKKSQIPFVLSFMPYILTLAMSLAIVAFALITPCKRITKKPPIANIIAEDNSNLVISPKMSFEMYGIKFPKKYELFSLFRFRKHNIQLLITSVIFCALFVWISYFANLYKIEQNFRSPQFTVTFTDNTEHNEKVKEALEEKEKEDAGEEKVEDGDEGEDISAEVDESDTELRENNDEIAAEKNKTDTKSGTSSDSETESEEDEEEEEELSEEDLVYLPNYSYTEEMQKQLYKIENIAEIEKITSIDAVDISSHILVKGKNVRPFANLVVYPDEKQFNVTNAVSYLSIDEEIINNIKGYDIDGDLYSALNNEKTIVISDSFNNTRKFKFKPGDKIQIAKVTHKRREVDDYETGKTLLKKQLRFFDFEYEEYTIGAVIHNNPSLNNIFIYLNDDDYFKVTGREALCRKVNIYVDKVISTAEISEVENVLRTLFAPYDNSSVSNNHTMSLKAIEQAKNKYSLYIIVAVMVMALSPLLWFFSQKMFYLKRENEFTILQYLGALRKEIEMIHIYDGIVFAALGAVLYTILALAGQFAVYKFENVIIPKLTSESIRYSFNLPVIPFIAGLLITLLCGFFSAYLPYRAYQKKYNKSNITKEFGDDD